MTELLWSQFCYGFLVKDDLKKLETLIKSIFRRFFVRDDFELLIFY